MAKSAPIYINFVNILEVFEFIEKIINNIRLIKDWIISKEKNDFAHVLKNQEVEWFIRLNIANGVININIFTKIYRRDWIKIKFSNSIEIKLFIIPSKEKALKFEEDILITMFNFFTNSVKQIFTLKRDSPISLIEEEI